MGSSGNTHTIEPQDVDQLCFPLCEDLLKPYVGQMFDTLPEGIKFYKHYAAVCGFQVRMSTVILADDGTVRTRYILCNREGVWGKPDEQLLPSKNSKGQKRKRTSCRADCVARAIFQIASGGRYRLRTFNEGHTHLMVSALSRHLMVSNRKVDNLHQMFIISGIKANIGPMRTFRLYKELVGSYEAVGCTSIDFKNYVRDLRVYADGSDAHMLLEAFTNKQELFHGFKFFYDVDEENKLRRLIWTDETSVNNFKMFGEAVSFDATYNTNRYKMIFTPFTGRDNHGKCISFGAAIISHEDMESYCWVLEKFVDIMGHAPRVFITDQDPGLKKALASSWRGTRHRYCMWHITIKVAEKLPVRLRDDPDFKHNFGKIVWSDYDEPDVFEENWKNMIDEYDLAENRWFSDMFEDRSYWIPAYFRDISMSGLFRTTSLSESENSYFKRFLNKNADLVLLYTNYCSALDAQRHTYQKLTLADETGVPRMLTKLPIERHTASVYTNTIFKDVQDEIESSMIGCVIRKMYSEGEDNLYVVEDNVNGVFNVRHIHEQDYLSCSCTLFIRKGTLCKHLFLVLRNLKIDKIPDKYIAKRWCKFSILSPARDQCESSQNSPIGDLRFFKVINDSLGHVKGNQELTDKLYSALIEVRDRFAELASNNPSLDAKQNFFQEFYGSAPPEVPSVFSPNISKTKGSGAGGRRKSNQEKAMLLAQKPLRLCKKCNTRGHHDSRNCPTKDVSNS